MSTLAVVSQSKDFDTWAQVYDEQPNPLIALEERFLRHMLPDTRNRNVLDAGCGTGRWLKLLSAGHPASLTGIDASSEMLHRASAKLGANAIIHLGHCTALPIPNTTIDLVLASFVLSYLPDLNAFADELSRVTVPGASIFITDMHPSTAITCNWQRSFKANGSKQQVKPSERLLDEITSIFQDHGFELLTLLEPHFESSEKTIFEQNGKLESYESAVGFPGIYILQLRKPSKSEPRQNHMPDIASPLRLVGANYAVAHNAMTSACIEIQNGRIHSISSDRSPYEQYPPHSQDDVIDLTGYLLLPGLINAHDHLEFSLFPNLGSGPYQNSTEWATEIHRTHASTIARLRKVPKPVRLWWGAIRNLLCGVTTVCHHNPLTRELLAPDFPVRVLAKFGWAHSLAMDPHLLHNYDHTPPALPFILHAAEGLDSSSAQEIFDLDRMQILNERTVLVHGLALNQKSVSLLNQRGAAVVLCPTSNQFLFHCTLSSTLIRSINNVVLGSDSPLTSDGDLLDEIAFARSEIGLTPESLYKMVTSSSASVLHLRHGEGALRTNAVADIIAVQHRHLTPAETLSQLTFQQVELVILSGKIQLAAPSIYERLSPALKEGLEPLDVDGHQRWVRAPISNLLTAAKRTLGNEIRLGGKRLDYASLS